MKRSTIFLFLFSLLTTNSNLSTMDITSENLKKTKELLFNCTKNGLISSKDQIKAADTLNDINSWNNFSRVSKSIVLMVITISLIYDLKVDYYFDKLINSIKYCYKILINYYRESKEVAAEINKIQKLRNLLIVLSVRGKFGKDINKFLVKEYLGDLYIDLKDILNKYEILRRNIIRDTTTDYRFYRFYHNGIGTDKSWYFILICALIFFELGKKETRKDFKNLYEKLEKLYFNSILYVKNFS